jgi:hypothetical protein
MPRKYIDLGLNYNEIRDRIEEDMIHFKKYIWAVNVKVSQSLISKVHKKPDKGNERTNPSLEYVIAVANFTGRPIEWYLYGCKEAEPREQTEEEFMAKWPEEIRDACRKLKKLLLSDDPVIKPALLSNLAAFQLSLEQKEEIRKLSRRLQFLEERHKAKRHTGTDGAASSSTGKPGT